MSSDKKDTIIGLITIVVVVILGFIFVPKLISSFSNHQTSSGQSSTKKESSSSGSNEKKSFSSKKESIKTSDNSETYDDADGTNNGSTFSDDDYRNESNIGKSVHLTNAKIARVDKKDAGLWIETINDVNNPKTTHVQAVNLASYKFKVGDIVDIKATLQGMKKSMVTFDGDSDKYPTIWISDINVVK